MTNATKENSGHVLGANQVLLFIILLVVVLLFGRELLIPLVGASFFAMLMAPVCKWLEKKIKRPFAVIICVLILLISVLAIFAIVIGEITSFTNDLPAIEKKFNLLITSVEEYIQDNFGVAPERQVAMATKQLKSLGSVAGSYFGKIIGGITGILGALVITLVYTFLLLFHRERYEMFFIKLFGKTDPEKTKKILDNVTSVGQHYIKGRTVSVFLLWIIYAGGFLIVGLKSAILLGAIAALLSIIPYVGGLIGGLFPFLMALVTNDTSGAAVGVIIVVVVAHALSTYIIEPLVVGGRLKLSALSMIVFIIIGGTLWGIAGMILFVPMLAMTKILCDNVEQLKPYGFLVGDPDEGKESFIDHWMSAAWAKISPAKKKRRTA